LEGDVGGLGVGGDGDVFGFDVGGDGRSLGRNTETFRFVGTIEFLKVGEFEGLKTKVK
jgi:hypothetical protein